jgi:hypothetical protein
VRLVPAGVVTVTSTVPAPSGACATISIADRIVKVGASRPPKRTSVAAWSAEPMIGTLVPASPDSTPT